MAEINPQEMTAAVRGTVGSRDITRNLGLAREEADVITAAVEHVRASQGRDALTALAGDIGFQRGGWETVLQAQIYTGFAPDGSRIARPGTSEALRFNQARDAMRTYQDFITHGYDGLKGNPAEVTRKRRFLREQMHDVLVSNQVFRQALAPNYARNTIPTNVVEEALRDDGIGRKLAETLNIKFNPDNLAATAADAAFDAKTEWEQAVQERGEFVRQRDEQNDRLTQVTTDRNQFNTQATYHTASIAARPPETRASAMAALQGEMAASADPAVSNFKANLDNQQRLQQLVNSQPPPPNLAALRGELTALTPILDAARTNAANGAHCREFESLYRQQQSLQTRRDDASREITRLNGEIGKKDIGVAKKKAAFDMTEAKPHAASGDFALTVEQSFAQAVKAHLATRAGNFIDTYRTERNAAITDAVAEHERQLNQYVERRWVIHRPRSFLHQWRGGKESINKGQAKRDFSTFTGRGVDALIADILRQSGITPAQQALMLQDKNFMERKRGEVVGKMLAAYVVSGGKLKKGQIDTLAMSDYGKDAIAKMEGAGGEAKSRIEQAMSAGYTKGVPRDLRERMIEGAPSWLATKTTLQILLSPMRLLRPGAIGMGRLIGTIDVT